MFNSVVRLKDTLYNYDRACKYKHAYLLEGCTDVWTMGFDSMAVFKSSLSSKQRNLIIKAEFESITIIYDPMATERAYLSAEELTPFIPVIKVIVLGGIKDVGERSRAEIKMLEKDTGLYRG